MMCMSWNLTGAAQGGTLLYSIICQAWKERSLGDPEGGDVEQEVSGLDIYMVGMCLGLTN